MCKDFSEGHGMDSVKRLFEIDTYSKRILSKLTPLLQHYAKRCGMVNSLLDGSKP